MRAGTDGSSTSGSVSRCFLAPALATQQTDQRADLLLNVLQDVVERKQTPERAVFAQNRRPTNTRGPHTTKPFVQIIRFAHDDQLARHHVVDTHEMKLLIRLRQDPHDDVSIREDSDWFQDAVRPVFGDDEAADVKCSHAPRSVEKSLVTSGGHWIGAHVFADGRHGEFLDHEEKHVACRPFRPR